MKLGPRVIAKLSAALLPAAALACIDQCEAVATRGRAWAEQRADEIRSPVRRVPVFLSFRNDYNRGHTWTEDDVLALLRAHPDSYVYLGPSSPGLPVGSPVLRWLGDQVNRWQAAIAAWNRTHAPDLDAGHICADWRPDLVFKHIDGSQGEQSCGSLMDAQQCAPNPCWQHYPENPCARWQGDMEQHWGAAGRFDTSWLLRVPTETWKHVVDKYYDGQDFCTGQGHEWQGGAADQRAICAANTPDAKVVLYAGVDAKARRIVQPSGVAIDLRKPAAREWNARFLLSTLKDVGIDPGEPGCVLVSYKPGIWSYYAGAEAGHNCPTDEAAGSWSGFITPRNANACPGPRPIVPNPYGPGEFEQAMNEQMRAVFRLMDQPAPAAMQRPGHTGEGYSKLRFIFSERPDTRGQLWWLWDQDIRSSDRVLGEMDNRETGLADGRR